MNRVLMTALLAFAAVTPRAWAQGAADPATAPTAKIEASRRDAAIRRLLEEHVRQVLRRYVSDSEFHAQVDVQTSQKTTDKIPYIPAIESAAALAAFTPERLVSATDKVEIQIALAKRYKTKTQNKLAQILTLSLGLRKDADTVKFDELDLELPAQRSDIELSLLRIEADLRQERQRAEQMRKERDDLKLEVVAAKSENDRQKNSQADAKKAGAFDSAGAVPKENVALTRLRDFGVPALFALVGIFVAFLIARSFGGIGRGLVDAAGAVSRAIEVTADSGAPAPVQAQAAASGDDDGRGRAENAQTPGAAPLEAFQKVLKSLHEELSEQLNEQTRPFVVRYLTQQLSSAPGIAKGVAAMELFGRDHANFLFQNLPPQAQALVLDFIRQGHYERPKHELMLEAGEELKTRLLGEAVMQTVSQIGQDITAKIVEFQAQDLAKAVTAMPERITARLMRYLEPGQIAAVLTEVHRHSPTELARVTETIMKVPEAGDDKDLDKELLAALTSAAAARTANRHKPYLKFYGEIFAAVDDQVSEAMFGQFMAHPEVAGYIRRTAVTFSMFFQVTNEVQAEVLGQISVKDVAALYTSLASPVEKQRIESLLSERRLEAVREEAQLFAQRNARQIQTAAKQARQAICTRMAAMQRLGDLEFQDEVLPSTAQAASVAAA